MYKINGYFPFVRCICGRAFMLSRATVCDCGTTIRFRRVPRQRRFCQPVAFPPDRLNLAEMPVKRPFVIEWI